MADSCAATRREGATSSASIDQDTSIASTMVARSRGSRTKALGVAQATIREARLSRASRTAPWRFHAASFGTTALSLLGWVRARRVVCPAAST